MDRILIIKARAVGQEGLLCLNGLVLGKLLKDQPICLPVHEFIQPGNNRLQVLLTGQAGLMGPTDLVRQACAVEVSVELQKDRGPAHLVQGHVLFDMRQAASAGDRLAHGLLLDALIDLPIHLPKWRYLDALLLQGEEDNSQKLHEFLNHFIQQIQAGDPGRLVHLFSLRNRELAAAYHMDLQQVHEEFCIHLQQLCRTAALLASCLDPINRRFHPAGRSAVYAMLNRDFEPLLQFQLHDSGHRIHFPMHLGVLGGDVFILR